MVIRWIRFNSYLLVVLAVALCGCETTAPKTFSDPEKTTTTEKPAEKPAEKKKNLDKIQARLTVSVETGRDVDAHSEIITLFRSAPMQLKIQKSPLLSEGHVAEARLFETAGGTTMVIQFTSMGTHLLEQFTAQYPGRRFPIAAQFGEKDAQMRWIAAPVIKSRISNGILAFTPDASKEEAELIVRGLNNVAIKFGNQQKLKMPKK
jgi:preprotein translocase subunit SecD